MGSLQEGTSTRRFATVPSPFLLAHPESRRLAERGLVEVEEMIVQGKLRPPPVPQDLVPRRRLLDMLDAGLSCPVTLISAPAGYGKTTLASHWIEGKDAPTAWISLEEHDDSDASLVMYLLAAMRSVAPESMTRTLQFLRGGVLPAPGALEIALVNDLSDVDDHLVLVLDGTEVLRSDSARSVLSVLLRRRPPAMHVVLVGRSAPVAEIASQRAKTGISEIQANDLAFTSDETLALLHNRGAGTATPELASRWTEVTEGWVTGLRLALDETEPSRLEQLQDGALTGHVRDYLHVELLGRQTEHIRRFLLDVSIVDRMSEPLCAAVTGAVDMPDGEPAVTLEALRELGIPLHQDGEWVRFHRLVREFLASQRRKSRDEGYEAELHRSASRWFADNDDPERAVDHALIAGDEGLAATIVEERAEHLMAEDEWDRLRQLMRLVPGDTMCGRPAFHVIRAWRAFRAGRYAEAASAADMAESVSSSYLHRPGGAFDRMGMLHTLRSSLARARGDADRSIPQARAALAVLPDHRHFHRSMAVANLYAGLWTTGDRAAARTLVDSILPIEAAITGPRNRLLGLMCELHWVHGDLVSLDDATNMLESMPRLTDDPRSAAVARLFRGLAAYEQNDLPRAQEDLEEALDSGLLSSRHTMDARQGLAKVCRAQGRHAAAVELLEQLSGGVSPELPPHERWHRTALQAELALLFGRNQAALELLEPWEDSPEVSAWSWFHPWLMLSEALLRSPDPLAVDRADQLLHRIARPGAQSTDDRFLIELHSLRTLVATRRDDEEAAIGEMRTAVSLAERTGFVRHFLDGGATMAALLKPLARKEPQSPFLRGLLAAYYEDAMAVGEKSGDERPGTVGSSGVAPVDALTPKENAMLRLLSKGLYNKEIAERSFVSVETVKTHLKHIYRKLNVGSRRQAVTRARALGLLPQD